MSKEEIINKLFKYFGFNIPEYFAEIILYAFKTSADSQNEFNTCFDFMFDFWISEKVLTGELPKNVNDDCYLGYSLVPVEFFPFAGPAIGGIAYGFVVMAPELELKDYPIAEIYPAGDSVSFLGENTKSAFKCLISRGIKYSSVHYKTMHYGATVSDNVMNQFKSEEQSAMKKIRNILQSLNINMDMYASPCKSNPYDDIHKVPNNWRFEATADGIGVLAHRSKFSPDFVYSQIPYLRSLYDEIKFIEHFLIEGYPATALWIIREKYWLGSFERPFSELAPVWAKIYEALNRPLLSQRIIAASDFRDQL